MGKYRKMTSFDKDVYIRLYRKYVTEELGGEISESENISFILEQLPTDVINRIFDGKEFYRADFDPENIEETPFGFCGLCGWGIVAKVAQDILFHYSLFEQGTLVEWLSRYGHKVNIKRTGIAS